MSSVFADTALIPETPTIPTTSATTAATSTAPVTFVATRRSASHRARTLPSLGADLVGTSGADDGMTRPPHPRRCDLHRHQGDGHLRRLRGAPASGRPLIGRSTRT